jgi:hypothetical protein
MIMIAEFPTVLVEVAMDGRAGLRVTGPGGRAYFLTQRLF